MYKRVLLTTGLIGLLCGSGSVYGASQCPAVDCDCGALPVEKWRAECVAVEEGIKTECIANQGTPRSFCGVHGPNAYPVALSLVLKPGVAVNGKAEIAHLDKQLTTMYWSLGEDLKSARRREEAASFGDALQIVKSIDSNIDALFELQQQVAAGWSSLGKPREAENAWKKYSAETGVLARDLQIYGEQLWSKTSAEASPQEAKAYELMATRTARIAGKIYEQLGFALAAASQPKEAARAWQSAARLAEQLAKREQAAGNNATHVRYYQSQATARWNRASYYWMLDQNETEANESRAHARGEGTEAGSSALAEDQPRSR